MHTSSSNGYVYTAVLPTTKVVIAAKNRKTPRKLSSLETILICLSLLLLVSLIGLILAWALLTKGFQKPWPSSKPPEEIAQLHVYRRNNRTICDNEQCTLIAAHFLQNIDANENPCKDFYRFACGRFAEFHELPADKPFASLIQDIESRLYSRVRTVIEDTPENTSKPRDIVRDLYLSCMDEAEIDRLGKEPLLSAVRKLGGFPLLDASWNESQFQWEQLSGALIREQGVRLLIESYITQNARDSKQYIIEIDQQKLGLKTRKYYLNGTEDKLMVAYQEFIVETLVLFGADKGEAEKQIKDVILLEIDLAKISSAEEMRRDRTLLYNAMTLEEFKGNFTDIDLDAYLKAGFPASLELSANESLVVLEKQYLYKLPTVLKKYSKRTLANYIMWRLVQEYIDLLPESFQQPKERFKFYLLGISSKSARWEECVKLTTTFLPMIVGSMYVDKYFDEESRNEVHEMTENLRQAFIKNMRNLDWMDNATRQRALEKADNMVAKTGYPDYISNDEKLMQEYDGVEIETNHLFANVVRIRQVTSTKDLLKLRTIVDRELWFESPAVVDAYYAPSNNEIVFPAGILQFPFFTMGVPHYINYAMIGAVIGHEITHGFDDEGENRDLYIKVPITVQLDRNCVVASSRQHDTNGNLFQWWDHATLQSFLTKANCLEQQYSAIEVPEIGKTLNGQLTLGENIADNGGVKTAYYAYELWLQDKNRTPSMEEALPGLFSYTPEQMFFIAYANNWCGIMRPEAYEYFIAGEVHSPHKYRAIVPLQNFDKFSEAFSCPQGSYMNPVEKCHVW